MAVTLPGIMTWLRLKDISSALNSACSTGAFNMDLRRGVGPHLAGRRHTAFTPPVGHFGQLRLTKF
jgi:hypothetical protein